MDSTSHWVLVAGLLFPGLWEYVAGRQLVRGGASSTAAEQWLKHRQRGALVTIVSIVVVSMAGAELTMSWLWAFPLALLSQAAGRYPSTKLRVDGNWSFAAYLAHVVRFGFALQFTWVFVIFLPLVMNSVPTTDGRWTMAGVLTAVWLLWSLRSWNWMSALMAAKPISDEGLRARLAEVAGRAKVKAPPVLRAETPRGLWPNACALVSAREQRVLMGSTLLDQLSTDEIVAIFSHELAHIEHYQGRTLRRVRLIMWTAFVVGISAVPALSALGVQSLYSGLALLWLNLVFVMLARMTVGGKKHEGDSDVRAVELCGDAEALIRGLTKLHALNSLPRRWDQSFDDRATHPSLARRIQAIRAAAGLTTPPPSVDTVVRGSSAGTFMIFAPSGLALLEGVPDGVTCDAGALRGAATVQRSWAWGRLTHLCVVSESKNAHALEIIDSTGAQLRVPVPVESLPAIQAQLDAVDGLLAPRQPSGHLWSRPMLALAVFTMLVLWAPYRIIPGALILLALIALWRPVFPLLLTVGIGVLASCGLIVVAWLWSGIANPRWDVVAIMAGTGVLFANAALRRRREPPYQWGPGRRATLGVAASILGLSGTLALWILDAGVQTIEGMVAGSGAALIALGTLLVVAVRPSVPVRALALVLGILGLFPLVWQSAWYQGKFAHDPFSAAPVAVTWQDLNPGSDWPPFEGVQVRDIDLALSGEAVLLRLEKPTTQGHPPAQAESDDYDMEDDDAPPGAAAVPFIWQHRDARQHRFEALAARILDAEHVVVLRSTDKGLRLEKLNVAAPTETPGEVVDLPGRRFPQLLVDPQTQAWRVSGSPYARPQWQEGKIGSPGHETVTLKSPTNSHFIPAGVGGGGLSVGFPATANRSLPGPLATLLWLATGGPSRRMEIRDVDTTGNLGALLAATTIWTECESAALGSRRFLCSRLGPGQSSLWWVELGRGSLQALPIMGLGSDAGPVWAKKSAPNGNVTWVDSTGAWWVDPSRHLGARLATAGLEANENHRTRRSFLSAVAPSHVALAARKDDGWRLTVWKTP